MLALLAPSLPLSLGAPPPFPAVTTQAAVTVRFVARGVDRADYHLRTERGPLVVHVVAVDPHDPAVRLDTVLAHDTLVSAGETVSSMARRTGAVAGINADYFDIGATNQPLNVVVRNGALLRTPSSRAALFVGRDRTVAVGTASFDGDVAWNGATVPLTGVDVWPPQGGASLMLPAYGAYAPLPDVATVALEPIDAATYRVAATPAAGDAELALGASALAVATPPPAGTLIALRERLAPAIDTLTAAVGGGPQLLRDGGPYADPNVPSPAEASQRLPLPGAGVRADGTLLLVAVDGRHAERSVGLTRAEFAALLQGLGARDALAFDGGGSTTLVARVLGDADASVRNEPSDGVERPVADGLFVYGDTPPLAPNVLAIRPDEVFALAGARVPLRARIVDANGHVYGDAPPLEGGTADDPVRGGTLIAGASAFDGAVPLRAGTLRGTLRLHVLERLAALRIIPAQPNPDANTGVSLRAIGQDARGDDVAVDGVVRWTAQHAAVDANGLVRAGDRDAAVVVSAGGVSTRVAVLVGRHDVALTGFGDADGVVRLAYDLTGTARASYARMTLALPGTPVAFALAVEGDGSGVPLPSPCSRTATEKRCRSRSRRASTGTAGAPCAWRSRPGRSRR